MNIRLTRRALFVAIVLALVIALGLIERYGKRDASSTEPVVIGVLAPFGTSPGEGVRHGVAMAVSEINDHGGISGKLVRVVEVDTAFSVERAVQGYRRLAGVERAKAVIGVPEDGIFAIMEQLAEYNVPVLCTGNGADRLTAMVKENLQHFRNFFRVMHSSSEIGSVTSEFIKDMLHARLGMNRFALMTENAAWTESIRKAWVDTIAKIPDVSIVFSDGFSSETRDFAPMLNRIKEAGADYILDASSRVEATQYLKQWANLEGPPIGAIPTGAGTKRYYDQLGDAGIGVVSISTIPSEANPVSSKSADWWRRYLMSYGDPEYTSGYSYDAVFILKQALERKEGTEEDLAASLEQTDYLGVAGRWIFGADHHPRYGVGYRVIPMIQYYRQGPHGYRVIWQNGEQRAPYVYPSWYKKTEQNQPSPVVDTRQPS